MQLFSCYLLKEKSLGKLCDVNCLDSETRVMLKLERCARGSEQSLFVCERASGNCGERKSRACGLPLASRLLTRSTKETRRDYSMALDHC